MKKLMKVWILALVLCFGLSAAASAAPSKTKVKNTYKKYVSKKLPKSKYPGRTIKYYDINKDGVQEMILIYDSGLRSAYRFYTYSKGKVVKLHKKDFYGCIGLAKVKGSKKCICIEQSNGASDSTSTVYKISNKKLKKVTTYRLKNNKAYKNNKKIKKATLYKFWAKLIYM